MEQHTENIGSNKMINEEMKQARMKTFTKQHRSATASAKTLKEFKALHTEFMKNYFSEQQVNGEIVFRDGGWFEKQ